MPSYHFTLIVDGPDLQDDARIEALFEAGCEVVLYAADVWYKPESVKVGFAISFTRRFSKPRPLRPLEEIRADILALESESEDLMAAILHQRDWGGCG